MDAAPGAAMSVRNSAATKAARRRHAAELESAAEYTLTGWCGHRDRDSIEAIMANLRDTLEDLLGRRRLTHVVFVVKAGEEATAWISELRSDQDNEATANHYRRLGAMLREHGGCLITAMAKGKPSTPPSG